MWEDKTNRKMSFEGEIIQREEKSFKSAYIFNILKKEWKLRSCENPGPQVKISR